MITAANTLFAVEMLIAVGLISAAISIIVGTLIRFGMSAPIGHHPAATYRLAAGRALRRVGECYAGSLAGDDGRLTHLYVAIGRYVGDWRSAADWAARQGADLPTCEELLLIRSHASDLLETAKYWTSDRPADAGWAAVVDARTGKIDEEHVGETLSAVAVRRIVV